MGLSSKQVSSGDGLDWGQVLMQAGTLDLSNKPPPVSMKRQQQQQQQVEQLKCPRCDSTNTKFCYYNNYNKSQPRHFCKSCKRHWTKGGTLRNVPVGGGRKNKRVKTSNTLAATTTSGTNTTATSTITVTACKNNNNNNNSHLGIQTQPLRQNVLYQSLIHPPAYSLQHNSINKDSMFLGSATQFLSLEPNLQFPFSSSSSSFESNPSSISTSFQSSNGYNYIGKTEAMENSTINTNLMPTAAATSNSIITHQQQPWHVPITTTASSVMDMPSYWNWDDINTFVSTDLNLPWDDFELKP